MSKKLLLTEPLEWDVDDIAVWARGLDLPTSNLALSEAADRGREPGSPIERIKLVWVIQVLLAKAAPSSIATHLSASLAEMLVAVIASAARPEHRLRRSVLTSLALLYLKTRELTPPIATTIRNTFLSALRSKNHEIHEFASQALDQGGVLSRRSPVGLKQSSRRKPPLNPKESQPLAYRRLRSFIPQSGPVIKPAPKFKIARALSAREVSSSGERMRPVKK